VTTDAKITGLCIETTPAKKPKRKSLGEIKPACIHHANCVASTTLLPCDKKEDEDGMFLIKTTCNMHGKVSHDLAPKLGAAAPNQKEVLSAHQIKHASGW
jgi:hypothetical protein